MSTSKHIIIIALNAQGHIIPTIAFTQKLASERNDFAITLVTTPLNAKFIRSKIFSDNSSSSNKSQIDVAEMPFNSSDHGLPPNIENTDSVHVTQIPQLISAMNETCPRHAKSLIASIIEKQGRPLCVVSDVLVGWAVEVSKSFSIPVFSLVIVGAFGSVAVKSFWDNLPHCNSGSDEYTLPGVPDKYRFKSSDLLPFIREADGTDIWSKLYRDILSQAQKTNGWLCNTVEEIEGFGLELLRKQTKLPIWAVGPMIPPTMLNDHDRSKTYGQHGVKVVYKVSPSKCIEWLDLKPHGSVIYISFGSQHTITTFQMMELANGLAESGHPFIWVLRPPLGFDRNELFKSEWLPENFEEKITKTNQGLLIHGWAPQLEILSHKSTGAFLSHCGWNSVLESLSQGVPIIGWPMADDQKYNLAYLMEEMGVSVKLAGGLMSMIMSKEVSRIINDLMDKNTGKRVEMKKRLDEIASKMRAAVKDDGKVKGSSLVALEDFINVLEQKEAKTNSSY